jgi:hypothetical protein
MRIDLKYPLRLCVKVIIAQLILHPQQNHYPHRKANSEADHVNGRIKFIVDEVAPGGDEVVFEHTLRG